MNLTFLAPRASRRLATAALAGALAMSGAAVMLPQQAAGSVVWKADGESPIEQEWASYGTAQNCAIVTSSTLTDTRFTRITRHKAKGLYSYWSALIDGDDCYGERAEIGTGNPTRPDMLNRLFSNGEERWISWQTYLGATFPIDATTWQSIAQFKQLGAMGTPIVNMDAAGNQFRLYVANGTGTTNGGTLLFAGPAVKSQWIKFTLHVKFSPDPAIGFLELFGDLKDGQGLRLLMAKRMTWTLKQDAAGPIKSQVRLGSYRNPAIVGNSDVYYDGFTVATTRAEAEANAF